LQNDNHPLNRSSATADAAEAEKTDGVPSEIDEGKAAKKREKRRRRKRKARREARREAAKLAAPAPLGSAKGVETMFRNAYRAELDIISLAALKANIMISLNGFIISALMISGAFIFASSPAFLLPASVFLVTAATSIVFALLAASPEQVDLFGALRDWGGAVRRGESRLRDLRTFVMRGRASTDRSDFNLLIYEDRVRLSRDEYWERMQALLRDRDDVYHKMSDQLYWLGQMANRKFKLLKISYTAFRWGLLASVLAFVGVRALLGAFPSLSEDSRPRVQSLGIEEFDEIYEPSAVQQLADGRVLVVEDEASRAISVMSIGDDGRLIEDPVAGMKLMRGLGRKLNDLEGLSADDDDFIYAITSHSNDGSGERSQDREQLLRFRVQGANAGDISDHTDLRGALSSAGEVRNAIETASGDTVDFDDINIEGLAYHRETGQLLLGLRAPMAGQRSIILSIENPHAVFEDDARPAFGEPILLDLSGGGIRALSFDRVLDAFLIVNEIDTGKDGDVSQLWTWSGERDEAPVPISLPGIINLDNVESIDSISVHGEDRLLVTSDEGNAKKGRRARYLMLRYEELVD